MAVTPDYGLALSDPGGGKVTKLTALGPVGSFPAASADTRFLSAGNGEVIALRDGRPTARNSEVAVSGGVFTPFTGPFADHDRDLVLLQTPFGNGSQRKGISVASLATGRPLRLGTGDGVAGDPRAPGVFTSVAGRIRPSATLQQASPDSGVQLRDAGQPTVLLATARALNRRLRQGLQLPVALMPYPDPAGDKVAVAVQPVSGSQTQGIVVLSRTGRVLGAIATSAGPPATAYPVWSPSGTSLAFTRSGSSGPELAIWTISGQTRTEVFPHKGETYSACLWSPDGDRILCTAFAGTATAQAWAIALTAGGPMVTVHGPGFPVAWLPTRR